MVAEVFAGLSAIKSAFDIAKGLKDIDDATRRNAAVIELQETILAAQAAQSGLVERIRDLEKEVASFEAWEAEKQRYKLTDYDAGTFAYELKPETAVSEPAHRICAACYQRGHKSILQFIWKTAEQQDKFSCPGCGKEFDFGIRHPRETSSFIVRG